jgi:hypothetical protein
MIKLELVQTSRASKSTSGTHMLKRKKLMLRGRQVEEDKSRESKVKEDGDWWSRKRVVDEDLERGERLKHPAMCL